MTIIELLVSISISCVIISVGLTLMAQPDSALESSVDHRSALRNAGHAVTLLSGDIEGLRTGASGTQPVLATADANLLRFSTDRGDLLSYFFIADSSTSREDDFVLYRQVGGDSPEVVARHLTRAGVEPFFSFEWVAGASRGVRAVGIALTATNGLVGSDERSVSVARRVVVPTPDP